MMRKASQIPPRRAAGHRHDAEGREAGLGAQNQVRFHQFTPPMGWAVAIRVPPFKRFLCRKIGRLYWQLDGERTVYL